MHQMSKLGSFANVLKSFINFQDNLIFRHLLQPAVTKIVIFRLNLGKTFSCFKCLKLQQMRTLGLFGKVLKSLIKFQVTFFLKKRHLSHTSSHKKCQFLIQFWKKESSCLKWHKMHRMIKLGPFGNVLKRVFFLSLCPIPEVKKVADFW